jgi:hemerythrin-like domain-containing protein
MHEMNLSITKALHRDHLTTIALLERLETDLNRQGAASPADANDGATRALLTDLTTVLEAEVKGHFAFEETHLFPRFAEYIDPGIPSMLQDEHEIIRPLAESIVRQARAALAEGFDAASWRVFHQQGLELVEREVFHIQKEEMGFLPALEQILEPSDDLELSMAYSESGGNV